MKKDKILDAIKCLQGDLIDTAYFPKYAYDILYKTCKTLQQKQILKSVKLGQTHPSCLYELFGYDIPK